MPEPDEQERDRGRESRGELELNRNRPAYRTTWTAGRIPDHFDIPGGPMTSWPNGIVAEGRVAGRARWW